jgi:hypothetical protein
MIDELDLLHRYMASDEQTMVSLDGARSRLETAIDSDTKRRGHHLRHGVLLGLAAAAVVAGTVLGFEAQTGKGIGPPRHDSLHLSNGAASMSGLLVPTYLPPGAKSEGISSTSPYEIWENNREFLQETIASIETELKNDQLPSAARTDQEQLLIQLQHELQTKESEQSTTPNSASVEYLFPGSANSNMFLYINEQHNGATALPPPDGNEQPPAFGLSPTTVNGVPARLIVSLLGAVPSNSVRWVTNGTTYDVVGNDVSVAEVEMVANGLRPPVKNGSS